ncbi:MAG: hypothetical protein M3P97_09055 [Actinomycetota bacterium]|nr:hypothetical protein [Actinomycetota bacterium]
MRYADGRAAFEEAPPPKHLLTILGGDHSEPYQGSPALPQVRVVTTATLDFFDHTCGAPPTGSTGWRPTPTCAA